MAETLGQTVERLMAARHWMQQDLAEASGLSESSVQRIIAGVGYNPTLRTIQALARGLQVSMEDLLGEQPMAPGAEDMERELLAYYRLLLPEDQKKVIRLTEALGALQREQERARRRSREFQPGALDEFAEPRY